MVFETNWSSSVPLEVSPGFSTDGEEGEELEDHVEEQDEGMDGKEEDDGYMAGIVLRATK
jgi:hypothetical protein